MAENQADFTVDGVESEDDVRTIREGLTELDGVMEVEIDPDAGEASVRFDYDVLSEERVRQAVRDLGYETG